MGTVAACETRLECCGQAGPHLKSSTPHTNTSPSSRCRRKTGGSRQTGWALLASRRGTRSHPTWQNLGPATTCLMPRPPSTWSDSALVSWEGPLSASADTMHSSSTTASARRSSRCTGEPGWWPVSLAVPWKRPCLSQTRTRTMPHTRGEQTSLPTTPTQPAAHLPQRQRRVVRRQRRGRRVERRRIATLAGSLPLPRHRHLARKPKLREGQRAQERHLVAQPGPTAFYTTTHTHTRARARARAHTQAITTKTGTREQPHPRCPA